MGVRKKFTDEFKTQVVLEVLKEEKTLAQLASNYAVSSTQLIRWRDQAIQSLGRSFSDERKAQNALKDQYEAKIAELYSEIGRLTTQVTWLKKKSGLKLD